MKLFYRNCKNLDMQNVERLCCVTKHGFLDVWGPNEFWRKTILAHNANQLTCETRWGASFTDTVVVTVSVCCYMLQILARVLDTTSSTEILQCEISGMSRKSNTWCANSTVIPAFGGPAWEAQGVLPNVAKPPSLAFEFTLGTGTSSNKVQHRWKRRQKSSWCNSVSVYLSVLGIQWAEHREQYMKLLI